MQFIIVKISAVTCFTPAVESAIIFAVAHQTMEKEQFVNLMSQVEADMFHRHLSPYTDPDILPSHNYQNPPAHPTPALPWESG